MKYLCTFFLLTATLSLGSFANTTSDVILEKKSNYNSWGTAWDTVYVLKNNLVTLAIVPKLGGRIMQYDLGSHPSIFVNDSAKGKLPTSGDSLIGGFRMLPSPQSDFEWPSPPKLDYGTYTCTILKNTPDSVVVSLASPIEDSDLDKYKTHKGLQFKRLITLYKGSTKVRVQMIMLNKGTQTVKHGIWDITQSTCVNNGTADLANFWINFERSTGSTLGGGRGYVQYAEAAIDTLGHLDSSQWKPTAAGGNIMSVQYLKKVGKIGADCKAGWISFSDRLDAYSYIKTFTYEQGKTYPDSGASVQVYTYKDYNMLEVEVLGPLVNLAPGDSTTLTEIWYAARSAGPVLKVTSGGLCTRRLAAIQKTDTLQVSGCIGLFAAGSVKYQFCSATGAVLATVDSASVNPTDSLAFNKWLKITPNATSFRLAAFDKNGIMTGTIDSVAVPQPVGLANGMQSLNHISISVRAERARVELVLPCKGSFTVSLYHPNGKLASSNFVPAEKGGQVMMNYYMLVPGVYLMHVTGSSINYAGRVTLTSQ